MARAALRACLLGLSLASPAAERVHSEQSIDWRTAIAAAGTVAVGASHQPVQHFQPHRPLEGLLTGVDAASSVPRGGAEESKEAVESTRSVLRRHADDAVARANDVPLIYGLPQLVGMMRVRGDQKYKDLEAFLERDLAKHHQPAPGLVARLVASFRSRRRFRERRLPKDLVQILKDKKLVRFSPKVGTFKFPSPWTSHSEENVEHFAVQGKDGQRRLVLMHFLPRKNRSPEQLRAMQNVLRASEKLSKLTRKDSHKHWGQPFLHVYARTHSPLQLSQDSGAEVLVAFEPFSGTLREFLRKEKVPLWKSLALFFSVLHGLDKLNHYEISHTPITADKVLVTHTLQDKSGARSAICPSAFNTDLRVCSASKRFGRKIRGKKALPDAVDPSDVMKDDIKKCGEMLKWILRASQSDRKVDLRPLQVLADSMAAGSLGDHLTGGSGVYREFTKRVIKSNALHAYKQEVVSRKRAKEGKDKKADSSASDDVIEDWEELMQLLEHADADLGPFAHHLHKVAQWAALKAEEDPTEVAEVEDYEEHEGGELGTSEAMVTNELRQFWRGMERSDMDGDHVTEAELASEMWADDRDGGDDMDDGFDDDAGDNEGDDDFNEIEEAADEFMEEVEAELEAEGGGAE